MANITITASAFRLGANAKTAVGVSGAAITQGQMLYADSAASGKLKLTDADLSEAAATPVGIACQSVASADQPVQYCYEDDDMTPGATLVLTAAADGGIYILSATAGAICPVTDKAANMYPCVLAVAKSATKWAFKIIKPKTGTPLS